MHLFWRILALKNAIVGWSRDIRDTSSAAFRWFTFWVCFLPAIIVTIVTGIVSSPINMVPALLVGMVITGIVLGSFVDN